MRPHTVSDEEYYSYSRTGRNGILIRVVFRLGPESLIPRIYIRNLRGDLEPLRDQFVDINEDTLVNLRKSGGLVAIAGLGEIVFSRLYEVVYLLKDCADVESVMLDSLTHKTNFTDSRQDRFVFILGQQKTFTTLAQASINMLSDFLIFNELENEIYEARKFLRSPEEHANAFITEISRIRKQLGMKVIGVKIIYQIRMPEWKLLVLKKLSHKENFQLIITKRKKVSQINSTQRFLGAFPSNSSMVGLDKTFYDLRRKYSGMLNVIEKASFLLFLARILYLDFRINLFIGINKIPVESTFYTHKEDFVKSRIPLLQSTLQTIGMLSLTPEQLKDMNVRSSFYVMSGGRLPGDIDTQHFLRSGLA